MLSDPGVRCACERVQQVHGSAAGDLEVDAHGAPSLTGEKDAHRARGGGKTKMPLRRAARPLVLLSVEPHPPLSWGWHRALASGPVAGSASYTLRSGCDVWSVYRASLATVNPTTLHHLRSSLGRSSSTRSF